ncbi:unnamed protein product [Parnassius apollo]|uniref:(apollo) hypothetical protein n=1 Tax=Parnassius apollo TaxID=110799 RepID=A0A8S3VZX5_PARAO|nr:unnamed protein product [Parnassius apollo]
MRALALHTAAERGSPPSWSWVPECKDDGSYEKIQCRGSEKVCWCVDEAGNEIPGTRSTNSTPSCDAPAQCPDPGCNEEEVCAHGRQLDDKGCPTCACRDPCAEAKCREDEICELVNLNCEQGEACPALGRCAPAPQCPDGGEALRAPGDVTPLTCGPSAAACPATHACRYAPHDPRPAVCCPKPRTVCFESKDEGICQPGAGASLNASRWYFNAARNRCERFTYGGCSSNHNNFRTKDECNAVCPVDEITTKLTNKKTQGIIIETEVLTPCERLREKNEAAAQKYGKGTFIPSCDASGAWESVQCMSHIDVCWCVSAHGEPQRGSLVRGARPACNFRQARRWRPRDPDDERARADEVLEELIRQMTSYRVDEFEEEDDEHTEDNIDLEPQSRETATDVSESAVLVSEVVEPRVSQTTRANDKQLEIATDQIVFKTKCQVLLEEAEKAGDKSMRPRCQADGAFAARQCARGRCWCVDAAGQRRAHVHVADAPAPDTCEETQIESALLELELVGASIEDGEKARGALSARLTALGARVPVTIVKEQGVIKLRALLSGPRAADMAFHLENMVKKEKLTGARKSEAGVIGADVIRSEYRLAVPTTISQQREIVTESTVSAATSYHTALIVLAATSAFIISVLCVLVMLYRARLQREPQKAERFLPPAPPVYVLSADEKAELARALHVQNNPSNDDSKV